MPRSDASPEVLLSAACRGDRSALAKMLSTAERGGPAARELARLTHPLGGHAYTVGVTGAPGAGKSTLTSALLRALRQPWDREALAQHARLFSYPSFRLRVAQALSVIPSHV